MAIKEEVARIIEEVRKNGDRAIGYYLRKFDGLNLQPENLKIDVTRMSVRVSQNFRRAVKTAIARVKRFHQLEKARITNWQENIGGIIVGQIFRPVERVAVYVPGGIYPYPSTIVMGVIPAQVAGVKELVLATPPKNIVPEILYTAKICGIKTIYPIGGPVAIAALAIGTKNVRRVDMIVGPGNAYVTEAKRQLFGEVGIDGLAGPSEVAILVLGRVKKLVVDYVVADLLAQAEHSPDARSYLLTDDRKFAAEVRQKLSAGFDRRANYQIICSSRQEAIRRVNELAPEHLQIIASGWKQILARIKNAGAIFIGELTPTALGDYLAGPSHILPTGGAARFSGGLSVRTFLRQTSIIQVKSPVKKIYQTAGELARAEKMFYHKKSLIQRTGESNESTAKD